jgi:hypothetical protein
MRFWRAVSIFAVLLLPSLAQDQRSVWMTGKDLTASCSHFKKCEGHVPCATGDSLDFGTCLGYISGVADTAAPGNICIPPNVVTGELVHVTVKWMEANPDLLDRPASRLVVGALKEAFPCKR